MTGRVLQLLKSEPLSGVDIVRCSAGVEGVFLVRISPPGHV